MIESSAPTVLESASIAECCAASTAAKIESGAERVALGRSTGRILAEDVRAPFAFPPFVSSAMDGFAVRAGDCQPGAKLRLIGESRAGIALDRELSAGTAAAISTGAPLPPGADAVVPRE
ncbi:MAG: hypothetical protein WBK99_00185, partial [Solirubrobacterales bacterium]